MRYYVTSDVHSYFRELKESLTKAGFFEDQEPHKLIVCGDLFDRGTESCALQSFILDLLDKDQVILIKGNHEDLALTLLYQCLFTNYIPEHHYANGTIDTVCQLTNSTTQTLRTDYQAVAQAFANTPFIKTIIPAMLVFYETKHYIFTHGWIPCTLFQYRSYAKEYVFIEDWRNAAKDAWNQARWINGMEAAHNGIIEKDKTIVCGHWHCSFGHSRYEGDGGEFDHDPNFTPYYGDGIIALDACTPISPTVNCIVLED